MRKHTMRLAFMVDTDRPGLALSGDFGSLFLRRHPNGPSKKGVSDGLLSDINWFILAISWLLFLFSNTEPVHKRRRLLATIPACDFLVIQGH
jgi:hypothetical protein